MEFKDRIRELRIQRKLTLSQLAAAMNKSEGAIRSWETGRAKPDADSLVKLSSFFGCTTDYLLGLSDLAMLPDKNAENMANIARACIYYWSMQMHDVYTEIEKAERRLSELENERDQLQEYLTKKREEYSVIDSKVSEFEKELALYSPQKKNNFC